MKAIDYVHHRKDGSSKPAVASKPTLADHAAAAGINLFNARLIRFRRP